jgi:DNA-binding GntR family transcriptional regulator
MVFSKDSVQARHHNMLRNALPLAPPSRENVMSVYKRIRRMILSGKLKGGQPLSQVQLALDFETSRGPVREALRMLQREGLIEAATNQQGRIVTFAVADLEQVCSLLVLNAALAIASGADRFTARDVTALRQAIARIEGLASADASPQSVVDHNATRRQLAFRRLLTILCKYGGQHATQLVDDLLDRVAMFRQLNEMMGVSPPYPLANRFGELAEACERRDAKAMALVIVEKIADVSRKALAYVDERYQPRQLDLYVGAAKAALAVSETRFGILGEPGGSGGMTIRVRGLPGSRVECVIVQD